MHSEAEKLCREMLRSGLSPYRARKVLEARCIDTEIIEKCIADYSDQYRQRVETMSQAGRLIGAMAFFGGIGVFLYWVVVPANRSVFVFPLLAVAAWGFFKMLMSGRGR